MSRVNRHPVHFGKSEAPFLDTRDIVVKNQRSGTEKPPKMLSTPIKDSHSSFILPGQTCQRFTLSEIESATQNFDEALVIGQGGFGKVYKCSKTGSMTEVAVK
uniref:Protein kinase domain-containing protein n=1 Tax=Lactuca sativa TaxID=4236 RepID=A0A9R1XIT2_LACSA|nr:hypothetical protein LSAT_V11C400221440 [Lactuca sativa]